MKNAEIAGKIVGFVLGALVGMLFLNFVIAPIFLGATAIEVLRLLL